MFHLLTSSEALLNALVELQAWADEIQLCVAWASGAGSKAPHWMALDLSTVRRAIVGIDFHHTEPAALRALRAQPGRLKIIQDSEGTFHPKVLLGTKGTERRAIIGSSNFTVGGFSGNTELNVLIEGAAGSAPFAELEAFIEAQWSRPEAWEPTEEELDAYERAYKRRRTRRRRPALRSGDRRAPLTSSQILSASWGEYARLILDQEGKLSSNGDQIRVQGAGSYLAEAKACRKTWARKQGFAELSRSRRELLAGYGRRSSGNFGRMSVSAPFMRAMRSSVEDIARHLDQVPAIGAMSPDEVRGVLEGLVAVRGVALGAASRLLSGCRADLFFPVNGANIGRAQSVFGAMRNESTAHRINDYINALEMLWATPWYQAPMPDDNPQRAIWRARAAMIDALLYEALSEE